MSRAVRPVPARRHDPEMANYVYKGGQSLARKGKDARAPRPVAEPNPEPPRNGKPQHAPPKPASWPNPVSRAPALHGAPRRLAGAAWCQRLARERAACFEYRAPSAVARRMAGQHPSMTRRATAPRSSAPAMGIDRVLLQASLARPPHERFLRAVQLARFSSRLRQARWVFSHCLVSGFDPLRILRALDAVGVQQLVRVLRQLGAQPRNQPVGVPFVLAVQAILNGDSVTFVISAGPWMCWGPTGSQGYAELRRGVETLELGDDLRFS